MSKMHRLGSKHIVITGGTSGIGFELVKQLYPDNQISVIARSQEKLDALQGSLPKIHTYVAELADLESVEKAAEKILTTSEKIDILINNAAAQFTPHFLDKDFQHDTISEEITINLTAPALLISKLLPALSKSNAAVILNINSGLGLAPKTGSAVYCATKGGMNILSQSLSNQFANTNIRVAQAFLPLVNTGMTTGRGSGKLTAEDAAEKIISGLAKRRENIDIGKVKLLRLIMRLSPTLARKIMRGV